MFHAVAWLNVRPSRVPFGGTSEREFCPSFRRGRSGPFQSQLLCGSEDFPFFVEIHIEVIGYAIAPIPIK